jgi:hypothetical protein
LEYCVEDGIQKTALFSQIRRILLESYNIVKTKVGKTFKYEIQSDCQHLMAFEEIEQNALKYPLELTHKSIKNLTEIHRYPNENSYIVAPVGSGKSYLVMLPDILDILKSSSEYKILMPTDLISITHKQFKDIQTLLIDNGYDKNVVFHYQDWHNVITPETRIVISCYDSLLKFQSYESTHLICDEFVNISKRLYGAIKTTNELRDLQDNFFSLIRHNVCKFYDADIIPKLMNIIKVHSSKVFKIYKLEGYSQINNTVKFMNNKKAVNSILDQMRENKKITISCGSVHFTNDLQTAIEDLNLNKRILIITRKGAFDNSINETSNQKLKKIVCEDTTLWKCYDCVIWTPTITTGISFDDKTYFNRHYSFLQMNVADATQQAQMTYRNRGTLEKTIIVSIIKDNSTTLKALQVKDQSVANHDNLNTLIQNTITNSNESLIQPTIEGEQPFLQPTGSTLFFIMADIQEYENVVKTRRLCYDFFSKLYNWGSINMICDFYDNETEQQIFIEDCEDIPHTTYNSYKLEETAFYQATFLKPIPKNINNYERNIDIDKSYSLLGYGQSKELHLKEESKSIVGSLLCDIFDLVFKPVKTYEYLDDTDQIKNEIDMNYLGYDSSFFKAYFKKSCNIRFYEVKRVIFEMFNNSLGENRTPEDYINASNKPKDMIDYFKLIYGLNFSFKILELIEADYVNINRNIIPDFITELYINDSNILTINKKHLSAIHNIFETKNVKPFYNYLALDPIKKLKQNDINGAIRYAFKQIGLTYTVGRVNEDLTIRILPEQNNFRIQKYRFLNDPLGDNCNYSLNELDDMLYWVNDKRILKIKTRETELNKKYNILPKIQLLQPYRTGYENNTKDMNLLRYNITTFCMNVTDLLLILEECNLNILQTFQSQHDYTFIESKRYLYSQANTEIKKQEKTEKLKQTQHHTKDKRAEKIMCECGGVYDYINKSRHCKTPKHLKFFK